MRLVIIQCVAHVARHHIPCQSRGQQSLSYGSIWKAFKKAVRSRPNQLHDPIYAGDTIYGF